MPIIINEPIILTEEQNKSFQTLVIAKNQENELIARITFTISDNNGTIVKDETLTYTGIAFNEFWSNFNSGKYLYEELTKNEIDVTVSDDVESDFINT